MRLKLLLLATFAIVTSEQKTYRANPSSPSPVPILKQINRINDDGSYTFGYEAADGSFKIETRDVLGNVKGMFGFIDETGVLRRVSYSAGNSTGFQADGNLANGASTTAAPDPSVTEPPLLQARRPVVIRTPFDFRPIVNSLPQTRRSRARQQEPVNYDLDGFSEDEDEDGYVDPLPETTTKKTVKSPVDNDISKEDEDFPTHTTLLYAKRVQPLFQRAINTPNRLAKFPDQTTAVFPSKPDLVLQEAASGDEAHVFAGRIPETPFRSHFLPGSQQVRYQGQASQSQVKQLTPEQLYELQQILSGQGYTVQTLRSHSGSQQSQSPPPAASPVYLPTPPPQHSYIPPPQHTYIPSSQHSYIPPPQQSYIPPPQHTYIPPPQHTHTPPPQHTYIPPAAPVRKITYSSRVPQSQIVPLLRRPVHRFQHVSAQPEYPTVLTTSQFQYQPQPHRYQPVNQYQPPPQKYLPPSTRYLPSPFQQALVQTLGQSGIPPELLDDPYQQEPPQSTLPADYQQALVQRQLVSSRQEVPRLYQQEVPQQYLAQRMLTALAQLLLGQQYQPVGQQYQQVGQQYQPAGQQYQPVQQRQRYYLAPAASVNPEPSQFQIPFNPRPRYIPQAPVAPSRQYLTPIQRPSYSIQSQPTPSYLVQQQPPLRYEPRFQQPTLLRFVPQDPPVDTAPVAGVSTFESTQDLRPVTTTTPASLSSSEEEDAVSHTTTTTVRPTTLQPSGRLIRVQHSSDTPKLQLQVNNQPAESSPVQVPIPLSGKFQESDQTTSRAPQFFGFTQPFRSVQIVDPKTDEPLSSIQSHASAFRGQFMGTAQIQP